MRVERIGREAFWRNRRGYRCISHRSSILLGKERGMSGVDREIVQRGNAGTWVTQSCHGLEANDLRIDFGGYAFEV